MTLGPAVGTFFCGGLMAAYGWRPVFIVLGFAGLLWLVPWICWIPKAAPTAERFVCPASVGEIVRRRAFWGAALGHFCTHYSFYLMIVWLPFFLVSERHLSMQEMAREGALFYLMYAIASPILAWIADAWIRVGANPNFVRKLWMGIGHLTIAAGLLGCAAASARTSFVCLMVMGFGLRFHRADNLCLCPDPGRPGGRGAMDGLQNAIGNLAGVIVAPLTGLVVDRTGQFWWASFWPPP